MLRLRSERIEYTIWIHAQGDVIYWPGIQSLMRLPTAVLRARLDAGDAERRTRAVRALRSSTVPACRSALWHLRTYSGRLIHWGRRRLPTFVCATFRSAEWPALLHARYRCDATGGRRCGCAVSGWVGRPASRRSTATLRAASIAPLPTSSLIASSTNAHRRRPRRREPAANPSAQLKRLSR